MSRAADAGLDVNLLKHQWPVFQWGRPFTVYPKGRRAGGTEGMARRALRWMFDKGGIRILWIDVNHRNISRYLNRIFLPILRPVPVKVWGLNRLEMSLRVVGANGEASIMDFGSAERPEGIEGFGYDVICMNEAGHILKDEAFFYETLWPMGIEGKGASWFFVGSPKGRDGLFEEFFKRGLDPHEPDWASFRHTSFDNPLVNRPVIERFAKNMPSNTYRQEILAEFVSAASAKFRKEWFERVDEVPVSFEVECRYWDLAATTPKSRLDDPDWTSGAWCRLGTDGHFYICDVARFRCDPGEAERRMRNVAALDGRAVPIVVEQEPGASGKFMTRYFCEEVFKEFLCTGDTPTGSKEVRANPLAGYAEKGLVRLVRGEWNAAFVSELEKFPKGKHDDQVDSTSGAFQRLIRQRGAAEDEWFILERAVDWGEEAHAYLGY